MNKTLKTYLVILLIIALINLIGCYSSEIITKNDIEDIYSEIDFSKEIIVTTKSYNTYHFLPGDYKITKDTLYGQYLMIDSSGNNYSKVSIAYDNIVSFKQQELDALNTVGASLGIISIIAIVGGLFILILALSNIGEKFNSD